MIVYTVRRFSNTDHSEQEGRGRGEGAGGPGGDPRCPDHCASRADGAGVSGRPAMRSAASPTTPWSRPRKAFGKATPSTSKGSTSTTARCMRGPGRSSGSDSWLRPQACLMSAHPALDACTAVVVLDAEGTPTPAVVWDEGAHHATPPSEDHPAPCPRRARRRFPETPPDRDQSAPHRGPRAKEAWENKLAALRSWAQPASPSSPPAPAKPRSSYRGAHTRPALLTLTSWADHHRLSGYALLCPCAYGETCPVPASLRSRASWSVLRRELNAQGVSACHRVPATVPQSVRSACAPPCSPCDYARGPSPVLRGRRSASSGAPAHSAAPRTTREHRADRPESPAAGPRPRPSPFRRPGLAGSARA